MAKWLSSSVEKQPDVGDALTDLARGIREYKDAGKPSACRETKGGFWSNEVGLLRPGWKLFSGISVVFGIAGGIFSLLVRSYEAGTWADLALAVTVPVFVLGISLVAVARSMSDSGRFAVEYLNESCRMPWFCWLTLVAVVVGLVGRFLCTVKWFPNVVTVAICAASLGAAIDCLLMLAFVVCETIRCSDSSESIRVVSKYAARRLSYAYLKEAYGTLFWRQRRDYLEKWCAGRAIHPPSQYYGYYFRSSLHSGEGADDVEIKLDGRARGENEYKDYDLESLAALDNYLKENDAELYLSSPEYENEQGLLGILSSENVRQNERLQDDVSTMGREVVRLKKVAFVEEDDDFWDSQQSKLYEAVERGVDKADPIEVKAYLDAVNVPVCVLREVRRKHKVVRDAYGEHVQRGYDLVRLYLRALHEILAVQEKKPKHRVEDAYKLLDVVRSSVWEETKKIFIDMDYHAMELFTWVVQQMYRVIEEAGKKAEPVREMRGRFGGFYAFAEGWLEVGKSRDPDGVKKMRLVLHEGLTKWLLFVMGKGNQELVEELCDAAREIVFAREGVGFGHSEAVAQHFVLAGYLIGKARQEKENATAVGRLFFEGHLHKADVNFDALVEFYLRGSFSRERLASYVNIFYRPTEVHTKLLTGISHSSGFGMTGSPQMTLAFIFLGAHALKSSGRVPYPVRDMAGRINQQYIDTVDEVFKGGGLDHGLCELRKWLEECDKLHDAEQARQIAEAEFDPKKVEEWKRKFWEGYSRAMPVLAMCLKNGNYEIDNDAKSERQCVLPKVAVMDWKYPLSGAEGDEYGRSIGQEMEKELVKKMAEHKARESKVEGGLSEVVGKAVSWLETERCANDKGIVVVVSKRSPGSELHNDKDFVPSSREDVRSRGFDGFYRGFRIVWLGEESSSEGDVKAVGVDLREWRGIKVKEEVVTEGRFGRLDVRTWREEEIQKAIASKKLEEKDVNKAKGNCPVDVSFSWEYVEGELPRRKAFTAVPPKGANGEGVETLRKPKNRKRKPAKEKAAKKSKKKKGM